jgi:hypothetical protein
MNRPMRRPAAARATTPLALAAALLALAAGGCHRERGSPDEQAARAAVARYNERLVEALRSGSSAPLREVARPEELARVDGLLASLAADGKVMRARQTDSRVLFVTVNSRRDGVTLVDTAESWEYEHRALARPDAPAAVKRARYRLQYELLRQGGGFVVHQVVDHGPPEAG